MGLVIFQYTLQTNHWTTRSLGNTSKVTGAGADFRLSLRAFYLHSCHLHVSLSWRLGVHPEVWQKCTHCWDLCQHRQPIPLFPSAVYDVQCTTLSFSIGTPAFLSGKFSQHSLVVPDHFCPARFACIFFQAASHFWLLMPALMGSLHDVSAFDPAPGPLWCRMSSVNFINLLSIHEGYCKVRPDPSHLVLHGLNPWTTRHHHFYDL